jgi:hypothetical protein
MEVVLCKSIAPAQKLYMQINNLPKDPAMLLSYVNTELRDNYPDLQDFCLSNNVDINDLVGRLRSIDYVYDERANQFV